MGYAAVRFDAIVLESFETRAQRRVFVALLALFGSAVVLAIVSVSTQVGRPSPGFVVWQNLVVPAIGADDWPGRRAGVPMRTVLLAVEGEPVSQASDLYRRIAAVPPGTVLEYTFERRGVSTRVRVPTGEWRWRDLLPVYVPYLLEGTALLVMALVIFLFRPESSAARAGAALSGFAGLMLVLALDLFSSARAQHLYFFCESMVPAALLDFGMSFPEERRFVRRWPWVRFAVYGSFALLAVSQSLLLGLDAEWHLRANDWAYGLAALAGLVSVASLVATFLRSRNPVARQQVKVVLTGMVLAALVPALGLFAILALGAAVPMNALTPFLLLFPISIGYAVARHDLFRVDRYLRLGVSWAALSVIVFASYAGIVLVGEVWLGEVGRMPSIVIPLYVLAMLLCLNPLRERIQRLVDRLFYRQTYDYRDTIVATSQALATFLDSDRIAETALSTLMDDMAVEWAVLIVLDGPEGNPHVYGRPRDRSAAILMRLSEEDGLLLRAAGLPRSVSRYEDVDGSSDGASIASAVACAERVGASLLIPVRFEEKPLGVLLLGEKLSGTFFSDEDRQLLQTLVHQIALALTNARAYEIIRRTQAELVQAERLAAVGEMAAAVAHGIRNPVAGIRLFAELARDDLDDRPTLAATMSDIIAESDRVEKRVRSILDLTRPIEIKVRPNDLAAYLREIGTELRDRAPSGIRVEVEIESESALRAVPFDRRAMRECLETIAVNAFEAMGEHGRLSIRGFVLPSAEQPREAVIALSDDGPGMDAPTSARVFELFFTTKRSGTGVGLAMTKRLVERQGGAIEVETALGIGTTFRIRLPLTE